jgi:hypothetical protein
LFSIWARLSLLVSRMSLCSSGVMLRMRSCICSRYGVESEGKGRSSASALPAPSRAMLITVELIIDNTVIVFSCAVMQIFGG